MGAAEVAQPDLVLAESAARVFDIGGAFIKSTDIQNPISNAPAGATSSPAKDFRFPLSGQAFVDLQTYLLSGLYLPESKDKFQLEYPRELLEPFTKKDSPTLYDVSGISYSKKCFDLAYALPGNARRSYWHQQSLYQVQNRHPEHNGSSR
jgi:hypothetical protein